MSISERLTERNNAARKIRTVVRKGLTIGFTWLDDHSLVFGSNAYTGHTCGPFLSEHEARAAIKAHHLAGAKKIKATHKRCVHKLTPVQGRMFRQRGALVRLADFRGKHAVPMGDPAEWALVMADSLVFTDGCDFESFCKLAIALGFWRRRRERVSVEPLRIETLGGEFIEARAHKIVPTLEHGFITETEAMDAIRRVRANADRKRDRYRPMRGETAGRKLGLTTEERWACDVRTMAAVDETPQQAAERAKQDKRAADRERKRLERTAAGCVQRGCKAPLTDEERRQRERQRGRRRRAREGARPQADSMSRTAPWIAAGFNTRRTWERHGKPQPGTPERVTQLHPPLRRSLTKSSCQRATRKLRTKLRQAVKPPISLAPQLAAQAPAAASDDLDRRWFDLVEEVSRATAHLGAAAYNRAILAASAVIERRAA